MGESLGKSAFWRALAWEELRLRFDRTRLGPLWVAATFAVFLGVKILIFGQMAIDTPLARFAVFLTLGFWCWQYLFGLVTAATQCFISAENWVLGMRLPWSAFAFSAVAKESFVFALNAIPVIIVLAVTGSFPGWASLSLLPAVALYMVTGVFLCLGLGAATLRFRDIGQLINTAMRVTFFLTPILWTERLLARLGDWGLLLAWNPFTYYLDIVRAPLMDDVIPWGSWAICLGCSAIVGVLGSAIFARSRRALAYWY